MFSLRAVNKFRTHEVHNFINFQKETKRCLFSFLKPRTVSFFSTRNTGQFGIKKLFPSQGNSRKLFERHSSLKLIYPSRSFQTKPGKEVKKKSGDTKPRQEKKENRNQNEEGIFAGTVIKIGLYATSFTALVFGGCAIWQYENERHNFEDKSIILR